MTKLEAVEAQQRFAEVLALVAEGQERVNIISWTVFFNNITPFLVEDYL